MFRLLIITDTNIGGGGGTEQHIEMLATRLDSSRYLVDVMQLGSEVRLSHGRMGAVRVWHMPTGKLLSPHGVVRMYRLLRFVRSRRHHCIVSFFENSDILAALLSRVTGLRCVLSSRRDTGYRYSRRLSLAYRYIDRFFDRIVVPSKAVRNSLLEAGTEARRIVVIPNGVDLDCFADSGKGGESTLRQELSIGPGPLLLGIVALLRKEKDHATLLRATARLLETGHDVALLVVGEGEMRDTLKAEVARLGIGERVFFLGWQGDVAGILMQLDIFVLSSTTEGMSNAILEAMAAGRPVVATDVGGNPELVVHGETGYLVPKRDSEAMALAIGKLVADGELRRSMGLAGRRRVARYYSVDSMVDRYERAIHEGIKERS